MLGDLLLYLTHFLMVSAPEPEICNSSLSVGQMIETVMSTYDRQMLPNPKGVNVTIEIHVQEISSLSELTADFELDLFYSEIWLDPGLNFLNYSFCKTNVTLKSEFRDRIWRPDTCVVNSKKSEIHSSPSENSFVILYEDGTVWVNYRMLIKAPCKMDLKMFPFDSQECYLIFESYSYNSQEVRLQWFTEPVTIMGQIDLPDFSLSNFKTEHFRLEYPNGLWDRLKLTFSFNRRYGFYLFQAYFPTTLTVISSWIGFYLDIKSVSARITLGVSSLLALTFQFGTVLRHLPRVSYVKCLDVWMIFCVTMIFFTLVELAIISRFSRREREKQLGKQVITRWLQMIKQKRGVLDKQQPSIDSDIRPSALNTDASGLRSRQPGSAAALNASKKWKLLSNGTTPRGTIPPDGLIMANLGSEPVPVDDSVGPTAVITTGDVRSSSSAMTTLPSPTAAAPPPATEKTSLLPFRGTFARLRERTAQAVRRMRRLRWQEIKEFQFTAAQVDEISIILFPGTFLAFNMLYWCYYFIKF